MRRVLLALAGLAGFAVAVVPALGQSGPTVHATTDNTFKQATIAVTPGTTVKWVNDGGFHNVHFEDGFNMPPQSSPPPAWGDGVTRSFDKPGEYKYVCDAHASIGMKGVVFVNDQATVPQTTPAPTPSGKDKTAPKVKALALRSTTRAGLAVRVRLDERATLTVRVRGPVNRAVRKKLAAGTKRLVVLPRPRAGRYVLTLRAVDAAGNVSRAVHITVTVRR